MVKQKNLSGSPSKDDKSVKRKESISFNPFGALGKAVGSGVSMVGSGVSMVGNATKAVGSGVVQGTKVSYNLTSPNDTGPWVKYGGRTPKFISAPCHVMCMAY